MNLFVDQAKRLILSWGKATRLSLVGLGLLAVTLSAGHPAPISHALAVSFSPATNVAVGLNPRSVAMGDLNGDGKLDLAVANGGISESGNVSVLLGTGRWRLRSGHQLSHGVDLALRRHRRPERRRQTRSSRSECQ